MWLSVPQRDVARTRTTTCPGPADGLGTSTISNPGAAFVLTNARTRPSCLSPTIASDAVSVEPRPFARLPSCRFDPRPLLPLFPECPQLLLHRVERRPDGLFERLFCFRGGEGSATHVAHQPRHGDPGTLVMVPVPFQNHPGVEDVVVPVLEVMQAGLDFFLPLRDHRNVAALGPNVHALPLRSCLRMPALPGLPSCLPL